MSAGHPPTLPAVRRCVTLIRLLWERGQTSHEEAQKELRDEWPQRTYERDLATLREAGVNVESVGRSTGAGTVAFRGFMKKRSKG